MSSGAKVQLAWIKEVTPGVTPAGDWNVLTRISYAMGMYLMREAAGDGLPAFMTFLSW
ncbi:MAG: hypothetical protein RSG92_26175, partial [Pseudomonas sp.]